MRSFSRRVTFFERKRAWSRCSCEACMTERTAPSRLFSTIAPWSTNRFLSNGEAGSSRPSQRSSTRPSSHWKTRTRLPAKGRVSGTWLDEIAHSLEVDDQIARHRPLLLPGEDAGEVLVAPQRPVGVVGIFRRAPEAPVVVLHELRQERVPGFHRRDGAQAQFLDQPVLQRLVHPLDAALCLRRIRADDLDVELGRGAPELRHTAGPARRALVVHAEDAVLVAVEGHRFAVAPEIPAGRREVVECGLLAFARSAPGGCPPAVPTDPDVQNSRIRLFGTRIRYAGEEGRRMRARGSGLRSSSCLMRSHVMRAR